MNVAVMGASAKPHRYSYKAIKLLEEKGHVLFPVHPVIEKIEGYCVYKGLKDIPESIHTITIYLSLVNSNKAADDILNSGAKRVIFNPGAENPELVNQLQKKNIKAIEACTLVMLKTGQF